MESFISLINPLVEFLESFIENQGLYAPILLVVLEEIGIPLPLPGDVMVISYMGYKTTTGEISYAAAFILLLICLLVGASILFALSRKYGEKIVLKLGKYLDLDEHKLKYIEAKFRKYGIWVIIVGRHIPGFRIPVTIFSGIAKISYKKFISATFVSIIFQIPFYLALGQKLGPKASRMFHGNYLYSLLGFIPLIVLGFMYYLFLAKRRRENK